MYKKFAVVALLLILSFIVLILTNRTYKISEYSPDLNTYQSGNFNLKFNYSKSLGTPSVKYPDTFDNETIKFNNGLSITFGRFEGFYGPFETTETLKTKNGKSCEISTFVQGFANEYNGVFAQCGDADPKVTIIMQEISKDSINNQVEAIKSIIGSLEYNSYLKLL